MNGLTMCRLISSLVLLRVCTTVSTLLCASHVFHRNFLFIPLHFAGDAHELKPISGPTLLRHRSTSAFAILFTRPPLPAYVLPWQCCLTSTCPTTVYRLPRKYTRVIRYEVRSNSLDSIHILPLVLSNNISVDVNDGITYASTYLLNRWYEFAGIVAGALPPGIHRDDVNIHRTYLVAHVPIGQVCDLVHLYSHISVAHLRDIARAHEIGIRRMSKVALRNALLEHNCDSNCTGAFAPFVFRRSQQQRRNQQIRLVEHQTVLPRRQPESAPDSQRRAANRANLTDEARYQVRTADTLNRREARAAARRGLSIIESSDTAIPFPPTVTRAQQLSIVKEWQSKMDPPRWLPKACAVCAQRTPATLISKVEATDIDLTLLRNAVLPPETWPTTYDFELYKRAILYPKAMENPRQLARLEICTSCLSHLKKGEQPPDSMANFQYYAIDELPASVREAFENASMFDLMMVCYSRATRVTHLFSKNRNSPMFGSDPATSQRFSRGNVAIMPQDVATLRPILPPNRAEIHEAMCALFVGSNVVPTRENIARLSPVIVSKTRVATILDFLLTQNALYKEFTTFSQDNLDDILHPDDAVVGEGVPQGVELCCLPIPDALDDVTSGYAPRFSDEDRIRAHDAHSDAAQTTDALDVSQDDIQAQAAEDADIVMEAVGYTAGDRTPQDYKAMKAAALAWCVDRKKFIKMQVASKFVTERDPGMLTFTFPHLDPWGIGGFKEDQRRPQQKLSFERQVRNLLLHDDFRFQRDPNFAYVCWNIIQKAELLKQSSFRTPTSTQESIARDIAAVGPTLSDLVHKWEKEPYAKPSTAAEKKALRILNRLKLIAKDLRGSTGYKQCRRNEIRAMIRKLGTPTLFLTLNPADIMDPLLGAMAGIDFATWTSMSTRDRQIFVARHPGPAAQYFHCVISSFISIVLKPGGSDTECGLFGPCVGYYGMVEAQGRGTLHCHMLVWIAGNPNPQELRDRMCSDDAFKSDVFAWLESIISSHLPGMTEPAVETRPEDAAKPRADPDVVNPQLMRGPLIDSMTDAQFEEQFREVVTQLAKACNWHDHTHTCWKHLKPGQERNDSTCRLRMNGKTRALTELDEETKSILLRRLHPRINNYNEFVLFLLRSNMDIKYIGSGAAAKALVFYITDYITKSTLPAHIGLAAVEYAIKRNEEKFKQTAAPVSETTVNKSLFIKTAMAIMSKQELSHQQVMGYLIGGGDMYCGHRFQTVRWADFDRHVPTVEDLENEDDPSSDDSGSDVGSPVRLDDDTQSQAEPEKNGDEEDPEDPTESDEVQDTFNLVAEPETVLRIVNDELVLKSDVADYVFRSTDTEFEALSLWEHTEWVIKINKRSEAKRAPEPVAGDSGPLPQKRGRKANARGEYTKDHRQCKTHMARLRDRPVIPVLLGSQLPRPDRTPHEHERWCRAMLILFKPWRTAEDLKAGHHSWKAAFDSTEFGTVARDVIKNMNVENECQDAREEHDKLRESGRVESLLDGEHHSVRPQGLDDLEAALMDDELLGDIEPCMDPEDDDGLPDLEAAEVAAAHKETEFNVLMGSIGLWSTVRDRNEPMDTSGASLVLASDEQRLRIHIDLMAALRRDKRPPPSGDDSADERAAKRRRLNDDEAAVTSIVNLAQRSAGQMASELVMATVADAECELDRIIRDRGIAGNVEQEQAIRMVGEHFIRGEKQQLLMYIAGVGGTGKSYVIKALIELFQRCGCSNQLLLSAPTGCAAVLINGYTIHALTFLPKRNDAMAKVHQQELREIWKNVRYLVIDEISMVSARFLKEISDQINQAKAETLHGVDAVFGNVNVLFLGDMGQLPPVKQSSLFSYKILKNNDPRKRTTKGGINAMYGGLIWRMVKDVVVLQKNWRALQDPKFTNLLLRIRRGEAWHGKNPHNALQIGDGVNYGESDYNVLQTRLLGAMGWEERESFVDAPIITATKVVRDLINRRRVKDYAAKHAKPVADYCSRDQFKRRDLNGDMRDYVWRIRASVSKDALGKIPLACGMKVMITENAAIKHKIVNGQEGTLVEVMYDTDEQGNRYARCAYVLVPGCGIHTAGLELDVVPILPVKTYFRYTGPDKAVFSITRMQLPLLPAYACTDFKSQGRSIPKVILDLAGCRSLQSAYVMLSRATNLNGIAILRQFAPVKVYKRLNEEFREELRRLDQLALTASARWSKRHEQLFWY